MSYLANCITSDETNALTSNIALEKVTSWFLRQKKNHIWRKSTCPGLLAVIKKILKINLPSSTYNKVDSSSITRYNNKLP